MVYIIAFLPSILLASVALAAPSGQLAARLERRRVSRRSQPPNLIKTITTELIPPSKHLSRRIQLQLGWGRTQP